MYVRMLLACLPFTGVGLRRRRRRLASFLLMMWLLLAEPYGMTLPDLLSLNRFATDLRVLSFGMGLDLSWLAPIWTGHARSPSGPDHRSNAAGYAAPPHGQGSAGRKPARASLLPGLGRSTAEPACCMN